MYAAILEKHRYRESLSDETLTPTMTLAFSPNIHQKLTPIRGPVPMKLISSALAVCLLATSAASGDVIPRHDPSIVTPPGGFVTGTGNLLYDSETNLEWLDVTMTIGRSINDVVGDGTLDAVALIPTFRYATLDEALAFMQHSGVTVPNPGVAEDTPSMTALQGEWGSTITSPTAIHTYAFSRQGTAAPTGWRRLLVDNTLNPFIPDSIGDTGADPTGAGLHLPYHGSVLVRPAPVPEPSSYALAGIAFVVVGAWASVRRRSKRPHGSPVSSVPNG